MQEPNVTLDAALGFDNKSPLFLPAQQPVPVLVPNVFKSNIFVSLQAHNMMCKKAQDKFKRIYATRTDPIHFMTNEIALLNAFTAASDAAKD